jgi:iron complex outermembrane receptor protein
LNGVVNLRTIWPKGNDQYTDIIPYYGFYGKPPRPELNWWQGEVGRQPNFYGIQISHYRGGGSYERERAKGLGFVTGFNLEGVQSFLEGADEFRLRHNIKTRYTLPKNNRINVGLNYNVQYESAGRFFLAQDLDSNAYRIAQGAVEKYVRSSFDPHFTYQNEKGHRFSMNGRYLNVWRKGNGEDINNKSNSFSLENQYQFNWLNKVILTTGLPINFGFSRSSLYSGTRVTVSGATYTQLEYKIKKVSMVAGLRYEINKVDEFTEKSIPVVRTGINFEPGKKGSYLRASWGQAYRLPSVGERFITGDIFEGFYLVPNPDLIAEEGWSSEIGFKQAIKFGEAWQGFFDFAVFWNEYDQYVEYVPGFWPNINEETGDVLYPGEGDEVFGLNPQNVEEARIFGYEISLQGRGDIHPMVNLGTRIGYTYTYPGNLEDDESLKNVGTFFRKAFSNHFKRLDADNPDSQGLLFYRSRHIFRTEAELKLFKKFTIGFAANYTSFPEKIPPLFIVASDILDEGEQTFLQYIEKHQDGDWLLFIRTFYQIKDYLRVGFFIENLTNRDVLDRPGKLRAPRNYTVQLKFSF